MSCKSRWECPKCHDNLIHQTNRGIHESHSAFGQWIHDKGRADPAAWRTMNFVDIDAVIHKRRTRILRYIEHKKPGRALSAAQLEVLPFITMGMQLAAAASHLDANESGVFIVEAETPWTEARITALTAKEGHFFGTPKLWARRFTLQGAGWHRFAQGWAIVADASSGLSLEPYEPHHHEVAA